MVDPSCQGAVLTNASRRWFAAVLPVLPLSARYLRLERRTASIAGGEGGGRVGCIEFLRNVLRTIAVHADTLNSTTLSPRAR
jgi:hypothetical protein